MRRLIIRPAALGDLVVSLPALESLRADYTEVWVADPNVPLIRFADKVEGIGAVGLDLLELGLAPRRLVERLAGFNSIVSWYGESRMAFRDSVAGLPFEFHRALPSGSVHAVDFYLGQVGQPPGGVPRIAGMHRDPSGYAAIHPFSGSPKKNWPLEKFQAVARGLAIPVEWCAGPEEELAGARRFASRWDLAEWLAGAEVYLGNDSGVSHLAAAVGTPVVAVFVATDPAVWAPRAERVEVLVNPDVEQTRAAIRGSWLAAS